ncbi:MAG: AMP-binding protein, partial [Deltaproteobacteria bacterium]
IDLKNIILIGTEEAKPDTITLHDFIQGTVSKPPDVDLDPMNDIVVLLYTGGTTGLPKGVMLSHNNFVACSLSSLNGLKDPGVELDDVIGKRVVLTVLPLCHSFGFQILISSLAVASIGIFCTDFCHF